MSAGPASAGTAARPRAVIVAGPTASGKSALAMDLAARWGGVVVNADSVQVYRDLRILTARPTPAEEAAVPHRLYGVRAAAEPGSAAWWRGAALHEMAQARRAGLLPILCGGTGLYLAALTQGLSDMPDPGPAARQQARNLLATLGAEALHARLAAADPATAARLRPSDAQRVARAWEVLAGTGRGLSFWQARPGAAPDWDFLAIVLDPDREALRRAIGRRLEAMLAHGALEEVRALLALNPDPALPLLRAHGVAELAAVLRGDIGLGAARDRIALATGQYTRRQATWLRHHALAPDARTHRINARYAAMAQFSDDELAKYDRFVRTGD